MLIKKFILPLFLAVVFFAGCFTSSTGAGAVGADRRQMFLISAKAMDQSANAAYAKTLQAARQEKALNVDPVLTKRVRDIAKNLIAEVGVFREDALKWNWQVNVIHSNTLNAWCMPGGKIVVYSGIVNTLNLTDAELAAIMGHEIAHALREHSRERASADQLKNIGIFAVATAAGLGDTGAGLINLATQYTISLPFSRSHETEADHIGTELMARAGYDPNGAVGVWEKMSRQSKGSVPELLSTHPSHDSRIKDLQEIAKKVEPLYLAAKKQ